MSARRLIAFKHDSTLGCSPAHSLFSRIEVKLQPEAKVPSRFEDYEVTINRDGLPEGIEILDLI
jgi:CRISPR-associated protein Csd2